MRSIVETLLLVIFIARFLEPMFQIRLLPAWSSLESILRFSFVCTVSRAVEQRRSSLQLLFIIFTHLFFCFAVEKEIRKRTKIEIWRSVFDLLWNC